MKNRIFKTLLLLFVGSIIFSCATHDGYMLSSASLSSNNFKYVVKDAVGTATATYIIGIGGHSKQSLVAEAKKNLLEKYNFKDNNALVNLTVNWKKTFVNPIAYRNRCTITADIVEFK